MKIFNKVFWLLIAASCGIVGLPAIAETTRNERRSLNLGRFKFRDVALQYRMGAGFFGDVNRTHPASIEPTLLDQAAPPVGYGLAVVINAAGNAVRQMASTDTALTAIYGILVRPFPMQIPSTAQAYGGIPLGANTIPSNVQAGDVIRSGYIIGVLSGGGAPVKGGAVFVWVAASTGNHVQGGFEIAASSGNTIALGTAAKFNGPADANGAVEIVFNV